jgi:alpha-glucosidase
VDAAPAPADATTGAQGPVSFERSCADGFRLQVTILEDAVVRFHYLHRAQPQPERGWIFELGGFTGPRSLAVEDSAAVLRLVTDTLAVEVAAPRCAVTVRDRAGNLIWRDDAAGFATSRDGAVSLAAELAPEAHIYGLGEKTGAADRRGRHFTQWASDPVWTDPERRYRTTTDPLYQAHPFLLLVDGVRATGSFLANTFHTEFDVGASDPSVLALRAAGGDLDHFLLHGPSPAAVLERYTRLVGRPALPPRWALGYHQSRWSYAPAAALQAVADGFAARALPCDGLWLDIDYMRGFRSFTWDPLGFPDPRALSAQLGAAGFKMVTILDPGIKRDPGGGYDIYDEAIRDGHFALAADGTPYVGTVWPGAALFPDFTRDATRAWWASHVGAFAQAADVRGIWIDMNEPTSWSADGVPVEVRFEAASHAEIHNVYALLMARASFEGALGAAPNRRPFVLTRAGFAGIGRYAAVWTGDVESSWEHLALVPPMLQGLSVSGVPLVGSDVGGFGGGPSPELYGRWFELGAVSPFFRSHVRTGAPAQEPWAFGPEVLELARRMLAFRYALLPYLYGAFEQATRGGTPLVRPLWWEDPSDAESHGHDDQFWLGPALLVAPVLAAGVTERDVYLPSGIFYEYYGGAAYQGPLTVRVPAPLGRFPVFVRAGSLVVTQADTDRADAPPSGPWQIDVYPGPTGTRGQTELYEDDGESRAYLGGAFARTPLALATDDDGTTIELGLRAGAWAPPPRAVVLRVRGVAQPPVEALVDGTPAPLAYDAGARAATIALADAGVHRVRLRYDAQTLPAPRTVQVTLQVALPDATPMGTITVGTSARGWQPDSIALVRSAGAASGTFEVPEGALVLYKYTRGDWATVEVGAGCAELPNRSFVASWGHDGRLLVADTVVGWRDRCP